MLEPLMDFGAEALGVVVYALGTLALSALGLAAEYNGLQQLLGGDRLLVMGGVALAFAVEFGRENLVPRVAADG